MEPIKRKEVSYWPLIYIRARELLLLCLVTELVILWESAVGKKRVSSDLDVTRGRKFTWEADMYQCIQRPLFLSMRFFNSNSSVDSWTIGDASIQKIYPFDSNSRRSGMGSVPVKPKNFRLWILTQWTDHPLMFRCTRQGKEQGTCLDDNPL